MSWGDKPSGQTQLWVPICQGYFCHLAGGQSSKAGLLYSLKKVLVTPKKSNNPLESCKHNCALDEGSPSSVQKLDLATRINPASEGFITNSNTLNQEEIWRKPAYSLAISTEKNTSEERYFQCWFKQLHF